MRPGGKQGRATPVSDIDMVPMMNLFTVLVPVLLLAAVFANVTVLELQLPPKGSGEEGAERFVEKEALNLMVVISAEGITVGGSGGFLPSVLKTEGHYDPNELIALLQIVRNEFPEEAEVTVASEPTIPYENVMAVMDICRERGFNQIALVGLHMQPVLPGEGA
ncbi:MAG: biopolymer transporter ExbD [Gemmatimonadetes bacterium]|nr:biopolymer transporter ExbD [Gemmatimonadota bacterium]